MSEAVYEGLCTATIYVGDTLPGEQLKLHTFYGVGGSERAAEFGDELNDIFIKYGLWPYISVNVD